MAVLKSKRKQSRLEVIHNYYKLMSKLQRKNLDELYKKLKEENYGLHN